MSDDFEKSCPNCGAQNHADAKFCRQCGHELPESEPELVGASAAASQLNQDITEITDPLIRMGPSLGNEAISTSLARILRDVGPRQAEILRRCAIPRWFDENVLAMLRERSEGVEKIFLQLRNYSFVRPLDDLRLIYHDEVRDVLLSEWRSERPDELKQWNQRLAEYFRERAAKAMPSRTLPKSPAQTTVSVTLGGEWDLYQREALYHTLMSDEQQGMEQLRNLFVQAEMAHRLGDAEALLQTTRGVPLDGSNRLWMRYLRARLDQSSLQLDAAATQYEAILESTDLDDWLQARTRRALGEIYAETARWVQATELYHKARDFYTAQGDQHATAEIWYLLGDSYQQLGESVGGWYVPAYPQNRFWRGLGELWTWLLSLPFYVIRLVMPNAKTMLPKPQYLASYHNWTLAWLYRTAAAAYYRAFAGFEQQGDDLGMLLVERQLANITRIFGFPERALEAIEATKKAASSAGSIPVGVG